MSFIFWFLLITASFFTLVAIFLSFQLIHHHLINYTEPRIQSKIIGILYMTPIYAIDSYLGLLWPTMAPYINMIRDCYEVKTFDII